MKISRTQVEKIRIEDLESRSLDPIEVIIENMELGRGKIVITCYGQSWTGFWGSMGSTMEEFFARCNNDYLIGKMSDLRHTVPDVDSDTDFIRKLVIEHRRRGLISKQEAAEAWWHIDSYNTDRNSLCYGTVPDCLDVIEGMCEPWHFDWPTKVSQEYEYLSRIIDVVREVISPKGESNES